MNSYGFSRQKSAIFRRRASRTGQRRTGHSDGRSIDRASTDIVYRIVKLVDPDLEQTVQIQEEESHRNDS